MELCRVCMRSFPEMEPIFPANSQENDIIVRIQFCTGVLFTKGECLPTKICKECLKDLSVAHKFKENCLVSESIFQNLKVKRIKTEHNESSNEIQSHDDLIKDCTENLDNDVKCDKFNNIFNNHSIKNDENCTTDDKNDEFRIDYYDDDETIWAEDVDLKFNDGLKQESNDEQMSVENNVRKSNRVRLKKEQNSLTDTDIDAKRTKKIRGPYKTKNGISKRRYRKFKFVRLACEACNLKFETKKESDDHKKEYHNVNEKMMCEICGKMMNTQSFYYHIRSHLPPSFACDICDYKANSKQDIVKHMRIHFDSKKFVCPICAHLFRNSSNLNTHIRMKHDQERKYKCEMCSRAFFDRTKLNRHVDSHNAIKRHCCEVCNACFTRRCYWKKHLQRHHGIIIPAQRPGRQRAYAKDLLILRGLGEAS